MIPERYFYLVEEATERVLKVFGYDDLGGAAAIYARESELRATHGTDDPMSGVVLRDSRLVPLSAEDLRAAIGR